jgi:hypothetical protein
MVYVEYLEQLLQRLENLSFISGEAGLKADSLHRVCTIRVTSPSTEYDISRVFSILRVYTLDWDRAVRASAFRSMRYIMSSEAEKECLRLSLDTLSVIRLESSKSAIERAEVLRFISFWLLHAGDGHTRRYFATSLVEILIGQITAGVNKGQTVPSIFSETLIYMVLGICAKFPELTLDLLLPIYRECFALLPFTFQSLFIPVLVTALESRNCVVTLPQPCLTIPVCEELFQTQYGIMVLSQSCDIRTILSGPGKGEFIRILISALQTDIRPYLLQFAEIQDLTRRAIQILREDVIRRSSDSSIVAELLVSVTPISSLLELYDSDAWRFPDWVNDTCRDLISRFNSADLSFESAHWLGVRSFSPAIPDATIWDAKTFSEEEQQVLDMVSGLSSGVQFKLKSNSLSGVKQRSPSIFQSVPLFIAVHQLIRSGSFGLQARRVVHGLFVHTLCDQESLARLDRSVEEGLIEDR